MEKLQNKRGDGRFYPRTKNKAKDRELVCRTAGHDILALDINKARTAKHRQASKHSQKTKVT